MKTIIACLLAVSFFGAKSSAGQALDLSDPEINSHIHFRVSGNPGSTHYISPLMFEARNVTDKPVQFVITNGQIFSPEEDEYQPFVIVQEEMLTLKPGEKINKELYGMCIDSKLRAPGATAVYRPTAKADSALLALTRKIEKKSLFTTEAQYAVWALTSDRSLADVVGFDTAMVDELVDFLAETTGQELPPPPADDDYLRNYHHTSYRFKRTMEGEFTARSRKTRSLSIAMFNEENVVVRELYNNPELPPGSHKLTFEFDATVYDDDRYFVKVIEDGTVIMNMKIETPRPPGG